MKIIGGIHSKETITTVYVKSKDFKHFTSKLKGQLFEIVKGLPIGIYTDPNYNFLIIVNGKADEVANMEKV